MGCRRRRRPAPKQDGATRSRIPAVWRLVAARTGRLSGPSSTPRSGVRGLQSAARVHWLDEGLDDGLIFADVHPLSDRPPPERSHDRSPPDPVDLFTPRLGPLLIHHPVVQSVRQPEPAGRSAASPRLRVLDHHHVCSEVACDPSLTQVGASGPSSSKRSVKRIRSATSSAVGNVSTGSGVVFRDDDQLGSHGHPPLWCARFESQRSLDGISMMALPARTSPLDARAVRRCCQRTEALKIDLRGLLGC